VFLLRESSDEPLRVGVTCALTMLIERAVLWVVCPPIGCWSDPA
jgi:hypothetical protein